MRDDRLASLPRSVPNATPATAALIRSILERVPAAARVLLASLLVVLAALTAGAHVLCEKPLSNSVGSCRAILDAAEKRRRTVAVGFNHRYYPAFSFMKNAIDRGELGTIDHLRIFGGHDGLANFRADWMYKAPLSGGGAMMDVGIHMTDLARFFIGEIAEVYGREEAHETIKQSFEDYRLKYGQLTGLFST